MQTFEFGIDYGFRAEAVAITAVDAKVARKQLWAGLSDSQRNVVVDIELIDVRDGSVEADTPAPA